ncbi:MAG TPA: hypothetical protein VF786_00295 [Terriglobales bacterium]
MKRILSTLIVLAGTAGLFAQAKQNAPAKQQATNSAQNEGERLFEVNCGRCHRPPEQISPKVAGSVLRHMRVRATLSKEDEQTILKFLAP